MVASIIPVRRPLKTICSDASLSLFFFSTPARLSSSLERRRKARNNSISNVNVHNTVCRRIQVSTLFRQTSQDTNTFESDGARPVRALGVVPGRPPALEPNSGYARRVSGRNEMTTQRVVEIYCSLATRPSAVSSTDQAELGSKRKKIISLTPSVHATRVRRDTETRTGKPLGDGFSEVSPRRRTI